MTSTAAGTEISVSAPRLLPRGTQIVAGVLLLILIWQVAVPIAGLVLSSLKTVRPIDPGFLFSPLTFANFARLIETGSLAAVTWTTLKFAFLSSLLALAFGTFLAWVSTRTDLRLGWFIGTFVLLQLAVPELLVPTSWTFLYSPELGWFNRLWASTTGADTPLFDIYSFTGMVIVEAFVLLPLIYLFAVPALSALDGTLEDAAMIAGAGRFRATMQVAMPLAVPALMATWVIAFMRAWEAFEVPWVLGLRSRTMTYATRIYWDTVTPPSNTGLISAYAVPMMLFAVLLVLLYYHFVGKSDRYGVISGKPMAPRITRLEGFGRLAVGTGTLLLVGIGIALPILMLAWLSFLPFYRPPSLAALDALSTASYVRVFNAEGLLRSVTSSVVVGAGAALLLIAAAIGIAWLSRFRNVTGGRAIQILSFAPIAIPNIIVGLAFLWLYMGLKVPVGGTYLALILAYFTLFLAITSRNIEARFVQVNKELYEASSVAGAGDMRTLLSIVLPMLGPAVLAAALYIMIWAFKELPASLLLSASKTRTVAVFMFDMSRNGSMSQLAAVGMTTVGVLAILILAFQVVARRAGMRGF